MCHWQEPIIIIPFCQMNIRTERNKLVARNVPDIFTRPQVRRIPLALAGRLTNANAGGTRIVPHPGRY